MRILALDLATHTGYALGDTDGALTSGSVRLKLSHEEPAVAAFNMLAFLRDHIFVFHRPDLACIEHWLAPKAMKGQDAMILQLMVHGVATATCQAYGVRVETVMIDTWRRHFLGSARLGGREEAKRAAIRRGIALRYLPHGCKDDNRAEAVGIWDYAASTYGRRQPKALVMFGEAAAL